nr:putative transposase [Ipomoea batatas]GMD23744.1 putative transposase [Ipomoea batatas]
MAPLFLLANQLTPIQTTSAIKLWCVRMYEVPERKGSDSIKCREYVLHDKEYSTNVLYEK